MRGILVVAGGVLMLLSSLAHGVLGWRMMQAELQKLGAGADLTHGLGIGWLYGSGAMATFGVIAVIAGLRMRRGDRSGVTAVRLIGLFYVLFGVAALAATGFEPHFIGFVVIGLLAGLPAWLPATASRSAT